MFLIICLAITTILAGVNIAIRAMNHFNPAQAGDDYMGMFMQFCSTALLVFAAIITFFVWI